VRSLFDNLGVAGHGQGPRFTKFGKAQCASSVVNAMTNLPTAVVITFDVGTWELEFKGGAKPVVTKGIETSFCTYEGAFDQLLGRTIRVDHAGNPTAGGDGACRIYERGSFFCLDSNGKPSKLSLGHASVDGDELAALDEALPSLAFATYIQPVLAGEPADKPGYVWVEGTQLLFKNGIFTWGTIETEANPRRLPWHEVLLVNVP
jgi:hypothetical protein